MLPKVLGDLLGSGPLFDLVDKCSGPHGRQWLSDFKSFLRREVPQVASPARLATLYHSATIPATLAFHASDHFRVGRRFGKTRIAEIGDNFCRWFLSGRGLTEQDVPETKFQPSLLCRESTDYEILAELQNDGVAEVTLAQIYQMAEMQPRGEPGFLATDDFINISYVRDIDDILRVVRWGWFWSKKGWYFDAANLVGDDSMVTRTLGTRVIHRHARSLTITLPPPPSCDSP